MTEFEERLTHEFSTLAAQYAQEQQQFSDQVSRLAEQVRHLADQQSADQQGYIKWSKTLGEQVEHLGERKCSTWPIRARPISRGTSSGAST